MSVLADATKYFDFDNEMFDEVIRLLAVKHYPVRIVPKKWPDKQLIGKAMVKGWAVPCRYFPRTRRSVGYTGSFVYPGITDYELELIHQIMRGWMV